MSKNRRYYCNSELAHVWASQKKEEGYNSNKQFYFIGTTIYSYGSHFPIATFIKNEAGEEAVWFTTASYRQTTACHMGRVRVAIPSRLPVFNLPSLSFVYSPADAIAYYTSRITEAYDKVKRARAAHTKGWKLDSLSRLIEEANKYAQFIGVDSPYKAGLAGLDLDAIQRQIEEARADELIRAAERARRKELEAADKIQRWQAGESIELPYVATTFLRVEGQEVVTSKGARFPVTHAAIGLALVERVRESGQPYERGQGRQHRLGFYTIDSIDSQGNVRAGCHYVTYEQIARIASQIKEAARAAVKTDLIALSDFIESGEAANWESIN